MSLAALARPTALGVQPRESPTPTRAATARRLPGQPPQAPAAAPGQQASPIRTDGFNNLVRNIPTETVTIFVAVCSARSAVENAADGFSIGIAYAACTALTPALLWLIAAGRHWAAGGAGPVPLHWWPLLAATVTFMVWALSVPGVTSMFTSVPKEQAAWGVLAGVGAVLVSMVLSLLERVFGPR